MGLVALLLFVLVPSTAPVAEAQGVNDIYLVPGSAKFYQSNFASGQLATSFVDNGTGETLLRVPVWNNGPAIQNVPVWYKFNDVAHTTGCVLIDLPTRTTGVGVITHGRSFANFNVNTRQLPEGPYNLTVGAFNASEPAGVTCPAPPSGETTARPRTSENAAQCLTSSTITCRDEQDPNNNAIHPYFVKGAYLNLRIADIRWCEGSRHPTTVCDTDMVQDDKPYNQTPTDTSATSDSYFEIVVENVGSWANLSDFGRGQGAGGGWVYELNISVTGPNITGARYLSWNETLTNLSLEPDQIAHRARSDNFSLQGKAGDYNVTVKADPRGLLRRAPTDSSVDLAQRDVEVAYRDFAGNFTASDFRTDPADAYPYTDGFTINGNITLSNQGPAGRVANIQAKYIIYLDNKTSDNQHFKTELLNYAPIDNFSTQIHELNWFATSTNAAGSPYIAPGKHTIFVEMDTTDTYLESNESNNNFSLDIYVADNTKPKFNSAPIVTKAIAGGGPVQSTFKPLEAFNIHVDVTDDSEALDVVANFTLASNASVSREINLTRIPDGRYHIQVTDFNFNATNITGDTAENWTLRVVANDSFGNNATSAPLNLKIVPWPIHEASGEYVVLEPQFPHDTFSYSGPDVTWRIRVQPNMTGFDGREGRPNQQNHTANLGYNITTVFRTWNGSGEFWLNQTPSNCPSGTSGGAGNGGAVGDVVGGAACDESLNNTFTTGFDQEQVGAGGGLWNYSILVTDIAGHTAAINGTLFIEDKAPTIHDGNLSTGQAGNVTPGQSFYVQANVSDDANEVDEVRVLFNRTAPGDNLQVNLSLSDASTPGNGAYLHYNNTIDTGRGTLFGVGGTFNVSIVARDAVGNWNSRGIGNLTVTDEEAPVLTGYGALPPAAQIGENVTFWATARDVTNVTMKLEIFRAANSQELLLDPIVINETSDQNFTFTTNFSTEAIHSWKFTPIDSVNRLGDAGTGTLTVRDNLGPNFDVRSPSVMIDGTRYGSGTPRIEIAVTDVEGVLSSSIDMKVAGLPVDFEVAPAPGNLNGYLVIYEVGASKKFSHQDVVEVNVTAQDDSADALTGHLNFSFVVDDIAPTARLLSISPSYRDQPAHVLNVSLASRFTLAGEDVDGLPTDVPRGGIRYRILGGGPSAAETAYNGPFKINDASGVYTGPRLYQIQFWAEDAVGNFNRNYNVTTVYVDDTPPALFQFFPQGRSVNATFVDDRVGVSRSVVWYRVNEQPYQPLSLTENDGTWGITLPEGTKGDRISYYLQAWDRLDNSDTFGNATNPYASFDVSNHEPRVRVTAPQEGSRVSRNMELTWEASDEDGDTLVFTVYYKPPGRSDFVELAKLENTNARRYMVDTTKYPDGQYTFRVAAGDGGFVKLSEATVTILNRVDPIGAVQVIGDGLPGSTMLIKAEVTKAEAVVEARLYLSGKLIDAYPMNDEGRDGDETANDNIYSVRVPVHAAGDYDVEIFTQYREDGQLKESSVRPSEAAFSARLTPGYIMAEYAAIIALIGLLAAVGIGVAVFVVMRRR